MGGKGLTLTYRYRFHQQIVKVVVVRFTFIQPYQNVNGKRLHGSKKFPLAQLEMLNIQILFSTLFLSLTDNEPNVPLQTSVLIPFAHFPKTASDYLVPQS
jgi:hypothetical protein